MIVYNSETGATYDRVEIFLVWPGRLKNGFKLKKIGDKC